jgi:DeoR family ulaG and ulaABCDEF operon transcriptional repressor
MCPHLEGLELQVVTNSLHIVSALLPQQKTRVYLPAGALFREQNILLSPFEDDGSGHYQASKMFIGAAGVGAGGLMQTDVILLQAERRLMARAMSVVLMVDSSKFHGRGGQAVCDLKSIGTLITDRGISDRDAKMVRRAGVKLIVVDAEDPRP